ncbi:MAG TPA: hypothetical protein PLT00_06735 [Verrucomicrobiota bacterium]|jgi:uncharacterized repeat protein (TIGR04138 family)|nr:hypothetical protein [Verrucomicrobiota bacterium]OQB90232.1 MAG: hypothetical protein BWX84_02009 [Verrucomicrobia bacterium ADurb.Bin118]HPY30230.1 hypothetical protein [Verrucomicrobiota bacterium]HQB16392.1 hypothetical protein [Verrucomicrobiota bacterium]
MHEVSFEETLNGILERDPRYPYDAYDFVREALEYTQKGVAKANRNQARHITGQELLNGIRGYAMKQFGPMTLAVFEEWNIRTCRDFGEIVFNLVEAGQLVKTEQDSRADFEGGYDFNEAFRSPFLPPSRRAGSPSGSRTPRS